MADETYKSRGKYRRNLPMTPLRYIRSTIFGLKRQSEMAMIIGTTQVNISQVEMGDRDIPYKWQCKIRDAARKRGIAWNDSWFFDLPCAEVHECQLPRMVA